MSTITRFAPSPTGHLHLGHAYSALFAREAAGNGQFIVRIEDIDLGRCRAEFEAQIYDDLTWLGLNWSEPVIRQSDRLSEYQTALEALKAEGLLYPCFCTRREIEAEIAAAGGAPHGPDGPIYPGICRSLSEAERNDRVGAGEAFALRLDMAAACKHTGSLSWHDKSAGHIVARPERFGDVVLARKDTPTSYHLAVTWDDHHQGVSLVTRGVDLMEATDVHCLLQALLGLDQPDYHHHPLLKGADGKRFAKRDKSLTIKSLREAGKTPGDIRAMISDLLDD